MLFYFVFLPGRKKIFKSHKQHFILHGIVSFLIKTTFHCLKQLLVNVTVIFIHILITSRAKTFSVSHVFSSTIFFSQLYPQLQSYLTSVTFPSPWSSQGTRRECVQQTSLSTSQYPIQVLLSARFIRTRYFWKPPHLTCSCVLSMSFVKTNKILVDFYFEYVFPTNGRIYIKPIIHSFSQLQIV